jgi:hypothetical protein
MTLFKFFLSYWPYFIVFSTMIPQIYHVAEAGQRRPFLASFVLGAVFLKILPVVYIKGYPENVFRISPEIWFVYAFAFYSVLLVNSKKILYF